MASRIKAVSKLLSLWRNLDLQREKPAFPSHCRNDRLPGDVIVRKITFRELHKAKNPVRTSSLHVRHGVVSGMENDETTLAWNANNRSLPYTRMVFGTAHHKRWSLNVGCWNWMERVYECSFVTEPKHSGAPARSIAIIYLDVCMQNVHLSKLIRDSNR